jgi:Omp85 superfamily domain
MALMCAPTILGAEDQGAATITNDPCLVNKPPELDVLDIVHKIFKKSNTEEKKKKKASVQIIPVLSQNPALGFGFGAALSAVGYRESEQENVSSIMASAVFSTKKQLLVVARSDLTPNHLWRFMGDWRVYKYTERTYGLGSNSSPDLFLDVSYKWLRIRQSAIVPVFRNLGAGAEYDLEDHFDIRPNSLPETAPGGRTTSSGVGLVAIFDSTDNRINASRGIYARSTYRWFLTGLGSNNPWQSWDAEARWYYRLPTCRRQVLAFWTLSQLVIKGDAPYFDLPSIGWDTYNRSGRGYPAGRFRGRGWLYGETEYRVDITRNGFVGAVVFANVSSFSEGDTLHFTGLIPATGVGLRLKVDKHTGSNVALDFGFGKQNSSGVYFAFNEAF